MYSSIQLHPQFDAKELLDTCERPACCTSLLKGARHVLHTSTNGQVFLQVLPHYLVNIALVEYDIIEDIVMHFTVSKASFVMLAMISGHAILSDDKGNSLTALHGNCCCLSHLDCGKYNRTLLKGQHQLLLLSINPDFLVRHAGKLPEIQPAIKNYLLREASSFHLRQAPIARGIYKLLNKLGQFNDKQSVDYDKKIMGFLTDSLNSYQKNLGLKKITNTVLDKKATEIAAFIEDHFLEQIVNHKGKMALNFCVSEKTMLRVAKMHFGKSLHQKVIELRLLYGLKQLQSSSQSVQQIADLIGYDRHYFSKAFKRQFGISPSQIRKPDT
jgi:AraC-like DNA-binding protein